MTLLSYKTSSKEVGVLRKSLLKVKMGRILELFLYIRPYKDLPYLSNTILNCILHVSKQHGFVAQSFHPLKLKNTTKKTRDC